MITKEQIQPYKNKNVKIILKNNYKYIGELKEVFETSLSLIDRFDGMMTIPLEEIRMIAENVDGGKDGI